MLTKTEQYDPDNLKHLLIHDGIDKATKLKLKQYKQMTIDGNKILVKYCYPNPTYNSNMIGRLYAEKGMSVGRSAHTR